MREFTGRVAVVTGAASGIGRAMAGRFAAEGIRPVECARSRETVKRSPPASKAPAPPPQVMIMKT